MTKESACGSKKLVVALAASLAVNVFAVGYGVGKLPGKQCHAHHGYHAAHFHGGHEGGPDGAKHFGKGPRGERHGGHKHHEFGHKDPFLGLFSKEEMAAQKPYVKERMGELRALNQEFAALLKSETPASAEAIEAQLTKSGAVMQAMGANLQQKMLEKIVAMNPQERAAYADRLLKMEERHLKREARKERGGERHARGHDKAE